MICDTQSASQISKMSIMYMFHDDSVPSRLSPQLYCGISCTWAHDVQLHIAGTNEPKISQQAKQGA